MGSVPAYLQTGEFETVWKLAHNMAGCAPDSTDESQLSEEVRLALLKILSAITWRKLSVRTNTRLILEDESFLTFVFDYPHLFKIGRMLRKGDFDKEYLDNLYIKRPEVIAWCEKDYIPIPPKWAVTIPGLAAPKDKDNEDELDSSWYDQLTENRRKRVTCLQIAKQLWQENPEQSYDDIYRHPVMVKYGSPRIFTPEAFKRWARPFAPDYATNGGRRSKTKQL